MENLNHLSDDPYLQQNLNIEFLINWVNQFQNYPHCSQAIDLSDFQSGIIFCELVYDVVLQRKGGSFLSKVITSNLNQQRCIQNISLALQEINDPNLNLTPQQVYGDTEAILQLIQYLQRIDKNQSNNDKPLQQSNQIYQQGIQQYKKPPLPNKMKLSGTYQENNKYSNGSTNNQNQYISPQFGIKQIKGSSGVGDELLEPDNESDAAYMENPYEMGLSQDNIYHQSNNSFQQTPVIQSNRSSQQNNKMIENDYKVRQQQDYMNGQLSNSHRGSNQQAQYEAEKQDNYEDTSNNQVINIENIQKMSQSLSDYFKKQNSNKNTAINFFNIQEDGYPVDVDSIQEDQTINNDDQHTPLQRGNNSQKNEDFDQSARNTSSQTKFYQMNKMRPGQKPFQEQIIDVPGEVTHQEKLKNYQLENDQEKYEDQPRQLPSIDNDYSIRNSFSQDVPHFPHQNNIFEETQPRKLNSVPTKEPQKYTPTKQNLIPMTMKDMAALQYPKKQSVENQIHYQDVKNILNNKYGEEEDYIVQQKPKFNNEDNRNGVNYFKNKKQQNRDSSNNSQIQPQQLNSHSFNCSPQHKNSFIIDKFTSNKHCSEQKIREAQEFLQKDTKEEKVNLKKILQGGVNISRISNKGDPLSVTSNGIVLDIEIETVSEKTRAKLLSWLNDIKLLKQIPNLDQKLHKICKDGIIFADIINLMEGKNQIIKGLERKPKKEAQITANYLKMFNYLKSFDKMNPRYLSQQFLIQQNENIFWGFLDDLWYFYHNKISPNDIRYNGNAGSVILQQNNHNNSQYSVLNINKQTPSVQQQQAQQQQQNKLNTNTSRISSSLNNNTQQTLQAGALSSQRRSNSQLPPNNLKQIQEEEDSHQHSQVQQNQDFLGDATVTSSHSRRRQYENYEDIMHDNHNETKRKKSNQRSLKDNNSITQGFQNSVEQNINALLTEDNLQFYQNNNQESRQQQQQQQYDRQQGLSKSPSNNPLLSTLQNIDVDLVKNWLKGLGFSHQLNKSERQQEQYMALREKQQEIANSEENQNNKNIRRNLRKKHPKDKLWGAFTEEEEKIITQDPLKNGVLLCLALSRIEMCRVDQLFRKPETIEQCYKNYDLAYRNIRARTICVPIELLWRQKEIFQGELYSFWQICHGLMLSTNSMYISTQLEGQENQIPNQYQNQMNYLNSNQNQTNPSYIQNYHSQRFNYNTQTGQGNTQNVFISSSSSMIPTTFTSHAQQHVNPQQQLSQIPLTGTGSIMQTNSQNQMTVNMQLPYQEESMLKLKQNLMDWVEYLGIFAELNIECNDFITFLQLCKDGAVLCYLMCKIFNIKIVGINRKACTKAAALSNIRKFLEIFKRTKDLPNIFFVTEESIYEMKEHLIIYLLEELMRYQDNIPSRQPNSIFEEPYLKVLPQKENAYATKENAYSIRTNNNENSNQSTTMIQQQNRSQQNPYYAKGSSNQPLETKLSMHNQSNRDLLKNYNENFLNQSQQNANENMNYVNSQRQNTSVCLVGLNNSKSPTNLNINNQENIKVSEQSKNNLQIDDPYSILQQSKRMDGLELNTMTSPTNIQVLRNINQQQQLSQTQRIEQVVQKNKAKEIASSPRQTEEAGSVYNDFGSSDADQDSLRIKNWLTSIGFEDLAYSLNFREQIIYQFKDGTILCKILEKLEAKPMKGINLNPKTNAHCKFNMSKCIEFLEKKSDMAQDLLWDQNELFECSSDFIKKFLLAVRYAYRKATLSLKRANGSSVYSQISQK